MSITQILMTVLGIVVGGGVTFAFTRIGRNRDRKTDKVLSDEVVAISEVKIRDGRITELERSVEKLESQAAEQRKAAIPIEAAMQAMLIAKLTNDHTPEADALLKKQTDGTLTAEDAGKFAAAMLERTTDTDPRISEGQRIAAGILAGVTRLKELAEAKADAGAVKTVMVTVPKTVTIGAEDGGTQEEEKGN